MSRGTKFPLCYDCQKDELNVTIKDPKMKKLFNIPEEFYMENPFLRSVKRNYIQFERLTDKQVEAFKKTVDEMNARK